MFFDCSDWARVCKIVMVDDRKRFNHDNLKAINNGKSRKRDLMKNIRRR